MKRSLLDEYGALCWRCGWPIYEGQPWERGHTVARHLGGTEIRPEHKVCNREDGHRQTKIAAKIKRMQNKGFNVEIAGKPKRQGVQVDRKKRRWRNSSRADKASKLKHDWKLPDD